MAERGEKKKGRNAIEMRRKPWSQPAPRRIGRPPAVPSEEKGRSRRRRRSIVANPRAVKREESAAFSLISQTHLPSGGRSGAMPYISIREGGTKSVFGMKG